MTELSWLYRVHHQRARGERDVYHIYAGDDAPVRLARVPVAVTAVDSPGPIIAETLRTVIALPGDRKVAVSVAQRMAQAFEDGVSIPGYPAWQQEPAPSRTLGADYLQILAGEREADEGLAPGTDATPEHLAMTGPRLRAHLDASPAAQPERGHGVPRLAGQAVAGHHGDGDPLRDLHVRRHSYTTLEDQA